jgi:hypothetical protein
LGELVAAEGACEHIGEVEHANGFQELHG